MSTQQHRHGGEQSNFAHLSGVVLGIFAIGILAVLSIFAPALADVFK